MRMYYLKISLFKPYARYHICIEIPYDYQYIIMEISYYVIYYVEIL